MGLVAELLGFCWCVQKRQELLPQCLPHQQGVVSICFFPILTSPQVLQNALILDHLKGHL